MDKEFWTPKFGDGENVSGSEASIEKSASDVLSLGKEKEMVMPVVGDKLRFIVYPYGQLHLIDKHVHTQDGQNVIEVEVTATKKIHVTYE